MYHTDLLLSHIKHYIIRVYYNQETPSEIIVQGMLYVDSGATIIMIVIINDDDDNKIHSNNNRTTNHDEADDNL